MPDLLVGNIEGRVLLVPNEGTRDEPAFSPTRREPVLADGNPIRVGGGDAGPAAGLDEERVAHAVREEVEESSSHKRGLTARRDGGREETS